MFTVLFYINVPSPLQVCTEILDENKNETVEEVTEDMETYVEESATEVLDGEEVCKRVRVKSVKRHEKRPLVVKDNTVGTSEILYYEDEDENPWRRRSVIAAQERRKRDIAGNISNGGVLEEDEEFDTGPRDVKENDSGQKAESFINDNEAQSGCEDGSESRQWMTPSYVQINVNDSEMAMRYKEIIDLLEDDVIRPFDLGHESLAYEICKTLQTFPDHKQHKETTV